MRTEFWITAFLSGQWLICLYEKICISQAGWINSNSNGGEKANTYTKELWIDRREKSKSLAWSTVLLALGNIKEVGEVVERPKALGDIRGVTYIYGIFYRFGLIDVPEEVKEKKNDRGNKKQKKHQKI